MHDVADLAKVSIKTVSRVINRESNVAPATARRVNEAIAELNYEPNLSAGNLRRAGQRSQALGLLVGNVANPFFGAIHRAIEDVSSPRRIAVFASSVDGDPAREREIISMFLRRRMDGLILASISPSHQFLQPEISHGTPIVFIDRPPVDIQADAVLSDNSGGAARAARHLQAHGHRKIACLYADETITTARERRRGFVEELARHDIVPPDRYVVGNVTNEREAYQAVRRLLEEPDPPTAIFCALNLITIGAVQALRDLGLHHQVALVGFDDLAMAASLDPALTVIAQHPEQIGSLAAECVFRQLDGANPQPLTHVVPCDLIARGSGEITPARG